jgi:solute carrier family 35 (adenosine 3'-phospho 5'-phosphosulfate transporter), member B2
MNGWSGKSLFFVFLSVINQACGETIHPQYRGDASVGDIMFDLSVNFLLYVVLIIVFYMLVRFYLEEATEMDGTSYTSYTPVPVVDEETVDTKHIGELNIPREEVSEVASTALEVDQSEDEDNEEAKLSQFEVSTSTGIRRVGSFLNVNEWVEPEGTRMEVIQKALFCAAGLIISFCIWALLQERILTHSYDGDYFVYSYGLVFFTRIGGLVMSSMLMHYYSAEMQWVSTPLVEFSFPSVANMLSSWCQYEALKYVSFPTQVLAKALKLVPVMLMGKFMHNKTYETYEYVCAATIGFGIYLFLSSSEDLEFGQDVWGNLEDTHGVYCGIFLLMMFLLIDSFTAQWQKRMFDLKKEMSPVQMMLIMNAFSSAFSFVTLVHQEELWSVYNFVVTHPAIIPHLLVFTLCATVGQIYIFYTVKHFGAVVFSMIMSTRILFSIVLSCIVYSHPVKELGVVGMITVFSAIIYRTRRKMQGQPLLRWKGQRDLEEDKDLVHEWHEHLDI